MELKIENGNFDADNYLSSLTMLADSSLLVMLFSGLDGPPLDIALKLPVILDWPLQPIRFGDIESRIAKNIEEMFQRCVAIKWKECLCVPSPMPIV